MKKIYFYICAALLCLSSCGESNLDVIGMVYTRSESSNERFAQSMEYNRQHGYETINVDKDEYRVYIMSDIHIDFTTNNLDTFIDDYLSDHDAAPFCLSLGDIINSVAHYDTCMAHIARIWQNTGDTCFGTVGNHDIYFDQWKVYREYWKTSTYWFEVKTPNSKDLYICLDSSDGTFGTDQRKWLVSLLEEKWKQGYRHIICFTHTHFFKIDASQGHTSNLPLEETYEFCDIFSRYGVDVVLQGHSHTRNFTAFNDVTYVRVDALEDHYYNAAYTIMGVGSEIGFSFVSVGPQDPNKFDERVPGVPHL